MREVADFIEEYRAAGSELEAAEAPPDGPGECTFLVAEELTFDDRLGQRGTTYLDEGLCGAQAVVVDRVGDELLARAAFAAYQHRCIAGCDLRDHVVNRLYSVRGADDIGRMEAVLQFLLQPGILLEQPAPVFLDRLPKLDSLCDHRGNRREQPHIFLERDGLGEQPVGAERADYFVTDLDRDAYKRDLLLAEPSARTCAVEKHRFLGDTGHDERAAGLHDLARDALAKLVSPALPLAVR